MHHPSRTGSPRVATETRSGCGIPCPTPPALVFGGSASAPTATCPPQPTPAVRISAPRDRDAAISRPPHHAEASDGTHAAFLAAAPASAARTVAVEPRERLPAGPERVVTSA